jgi:hypothetical protein
MAKVTTFFEIREAGSGSTALPRASIGLRRRKSRDKGFKMADLILRPFGFHWGN